MKKGYVIPLKEKIAFGSGDAGVNLAFDAINFYMLWFIVNVGAISPGMAGIIFLVAKVWDAVTDYFMGRISDNTNSSMGRRRPYIMFGAIDRKSTRLNSSHVAISYAVFCLKKTSSTSADGRWHMR